jgi:hypothetical protein
MNYDASWRANGEPALDHDGLVATRLKGDVAQVTFRYFPRTLRYSWLLFVLTLGLIGWALRRPRSSSATPDAEG